MVRRRSSSSSLENRIFFIVLSMFATMASFYVAARLWQDSQNRVLLINQLDIRTAQGKSFISVDDTVKVTTCREQQNKLVVLHADLEKATQEGFTSKHLSEHNETGTTNKKLLIVIGILTTFGRKKKRDAIRKAWMPAGDSLRELEKERGIVIRFVVGRSVENGGHSDSEIDSENRQANDFMILNNHIESPEERSKKTKLFLSQAVKQWDADFYAKANDDVYVNIDALGAVLTSHLDFPRAYIGCMKSGEVFSEKKQKWYEPDWWKFGEGKSYFQHASGEIFAVSQALAQFVSVNSLALRMYSHDDVSVGSWFIGLDVKHVDEGKFCCSSWSSGAVCSSAVK